MKKDFTFAIIKPEAIKAGNIGAIITQMEQHHFHVAAIQRTHLNVEDAQKFYAVHKDRPFYDELCQYMASGPIIAMVLEKTDAVTDFRKLLGATNPQEAEAGTIRKLFGESIEKNAVHGSDAQENAVIEANFFFPKY